MLFLPVFARDLVRGRDDGCSDFDEKTVGEE
jgi:hypothetical protein